MYYGTNRGVPKSPMRKINFQKIVMEPIHDFLILLEVIFRKMLYDIYKRLILMG